MTSREFFIYTIEDEIPRFVRLLKALPEGAMDYKPHQNSRSAAQIVGSVFNAAATLRNVLEEGKLNASDFETGNFTNLDSIIDSFSKALHWTKEKASHMSDKEWEEEAVMVMDGKEIWKTTKGKMAWGFILDFIHHRGQLSVYIRPMGGKVPPIYGPSGDSQG